MTTTSSSIPATRFLLDENVRSELDSFLNERGPAAVRTSKGATDDEILRQSKRDQRVIVTNDSDFAKVDSQEACGIVLLRIPQENAHMLVTAFGKLLNECKEFKGQLIILSPEGWIAEPLGPSIE